MSSDQQKRAGVAPPIDDNQDDLGRSVNDKSDVPGDKATVDKTREAQKTAETASLHDAQKSAADLHKDDDAANSRIDDL